MSEYTGTGIWGPYVLYMHACIILPVLKLKQCIHVRTGKLLLLVCTYLKCCAAMLAYEVQTLSLHIFKPHP